MLRWGCWPCLQRLCVYFRAYAHCLRVFWSREPYSDVSSVRGPVFCTSCAQRVALACRLRVDCVFSLFHFLSGAADTLRHCCIQTEASWRLTQTWYWGHERGHGWISFSADSDWERDVDFADITVRAQEDWVMWAGDGRPGRVCVCVCVRWEERHCVLYGCHTLLLSYFSVWRIRCHED